MRLTTGSVVLLAAILSARAAEACSCASSGPPCEAYFQVDAVFVGVVRTISQVEEAADSPYRRRLVSFAIDKALRGVQGASTEVSTGMGGGDCGYEFKIGERYLVYAYRMKDGSRLATGTCTRTRRIADAAEDLRFIEGLPPTGSGGRVSGTIKHWESDLATGRGREYGGVPFVHVQLRGPSAVLETETDDRGRYEIAGVPVGKYDLQAIPPAPFSSKHLNFEIEMRDSRACAVIDFGVHYDGRVSGVAITAGGEPAADLALALVPVEHAGATGYVQTIAGKTDAGGYYEFSGVSPGRYMLGVNLRRTIEPAILYPRTLHPGTPNVSEATVIEIGAGNHQQLEPLKLPPAFPSHELTGTVVWPDGRPAGGAIVSLSDGREQVADGIEADADGRFRFVVHEGFSYTARASCFLEQDPQHRSAQAMLGPLPGLSPLAPITLRLVMPVDR